MAKPTKNQRRREREKAKKLEVKADTEATNGDGASVEADAGDKKPEDAGTNGHVDPSEDRRVKGVKFEDDDDVMEEDVKVAQDDDQLAAQFAGVLKRFGGAEDEPEEAATRPREQIMRNEESMIPDEEDEEEALEREMSRKKLRKQNRLSIAELKALVKKPELVDWTDVYSPDPVLALAIRSKKNVIPVPKHWSQKRDYLSAKRGIEVTNYKLPKFILDTGIAEMREAAWQKQADASLKQTMRQRVQPRMGKLDIEYNKLHDAFFHHQVKPPLTGFGEVYYEGKEYETDLRHLKPGNMSEELKEALSIPPGAPPPWLLNQQRVGPPPSYPNLKIRGLNAPLPPGGRWGYDPGCYGKVPTDKDGKPLWGGDPFGTNDGFDERPDRPAIDRSHWGELPDEESEDEEESEDDEDEEDDEEGKAGDGESDAEAAAAAADADAKTSRDKGQQSKPITEFGTAAPDDFTLRKSKPVDNANGSGQPRSAGQVLPEQQRRTTGFFGSDRGYDLKGAEGKAPMLGQETTQRKRKAGDVDVSVDLDKLAAEGKVNKDDVKNRYDQQRKAEQPWSGYNQEDLSDMISQESSKRQKRDAERHARR